VEPSPLLVQARRVLESVVPGAFELVLAPSKVAGYAAVEPVGAPAEPSGAGASPDP
jgi:hypothetical protein